MLAEFLRDLGAVHVGHADIQQNQMRLVFQAAELRSPVKAVRTSCLLQRAGATTVSGARCSRAFALALIRGGQRRRPDGRTLGMSSSSRI